MNQPAAPDHEFSLEEVAAALFAKAGISAGLWRLAVRLKFAALNVNLADSPAGPLNPMPAGIVAMDGFALFRAAEPGDLVFDASKVGRGPELPAKSPKLPRSKSAKP